MVGDEQRRIDEENGEGEKFEEYKGFWFVNRDVKSFCLYLIGGVRQN